MRPASRVTSAPVSSDRLDPHLPVAAHRGYGPDRVVGLDVARALAVLGMLGAHVGVVAADVDVDPATWLGVVNGRPSILFAVLAGTSVALLSGGVVPAGGDELVRARMRILVRAAWVFAIGGVLEALGTGIDVILGVYAVLFVLALPVLRWPPRRLIVAAGVLAVVAPPTALAGAQFVDSADTFYEPFVVLALTGAHPALIWWAFLLVGLAVGAGTCALAQCAGCWRRPAGGWPSSATEAVGSRRRCGTTAGRWRDRRGSRSGRADGTPSG